METKIFKPTKENIEKAGKILKNGGLVAFPTETVYGLGANAFDENAVKSIYAAKGRPSDNPLIVHIAKKEDMNELVSVFPEKAKKLVDAFFPAPLTVILPKSNRLGKVVSGGLDTIAIRMPENETARKLIASAGVPIAAPSANTSGLPSPTKAKHVIDDMMGKIDAIIDGEDCKFGVESTVITLATDTPTILRPGAVTKEMLEGVIGEVQVAKAVLEGMKDSETAASPGMKYKHYSPKADVVLVDANKEDFETFVNSRKDAFALCFEEDNITIPHVSFGSEKDDLSQAKVLFDALRELDELGAKKVYASMPRKDGVGMAVYNRLIRAAAFQIIDLKKPFLIGLTGPTGAGKGYVGKELKKRGFNVLDTDIYARKIVEKDSPVLKELEKAFGKSVLVNGELDRAELAKISFSSAENTALLDSITHPAIIKECKKDAKASIFSVFDAPLLFECGGEKLCYKTVAVVADDNIRLARIMARDNITKDKALLRMNAQKGNDFYQKNCDYTITNNGEDINTQINNILEAIL